MGRIYYFTDSTNVNNQTYRSGKYIRLDDCKADAIQYCNNCKHDVDIFVIDDLIGFVHGRFIYSDEDIIYEKCQYT